MNKLYLADVNYNIIAPIDLDCEAFTYIAIITSINEARELEIICNTYLDEMYDFMLLPETCLVLEFDNVKIGFNKSNNIVTDLLPYANVGSGSDFNSAIRLDKKVVSDVDYPISDKFLNDSENRSAYYLSNTNTSFQKKYYRIKPFNFSNVSEVNQENESASKVRLYNEATNYLKEIESKNSIDGQIKRQNGVLELKFYSSSANLNHNKRTITLNQDYNYSCQLLANQLDSDNFIFEVLEDVTITLNTGMYSNYELLQEIVNNKNLSWREIGLVDTPTGVKTKIEIGDFDKLTPTELATNATIDDIFDDTAITITSVTEYFTSIKVDLNINKFIQEGENILVDYVETQENIDGTVREIFNIQKIQNFKGGTFELYKLL